MEEKMTRNQWLEYINKVQEKEKSKLSWNGVSLWVFVTTVISLLSFIIFNVQTIVLDGDKFKVFIVFFVLFSNFLTNVFQLINLTARRDKILKMLFSRLNEIDLKSSYLSGVFDLLAFAILLITGIYVGIFLLDTWIKWIIVYFCAKYFFSLIIITKSLLRGNRKSNIKISESQKKALIINTLFNLGLASSCFIYILEINSFNNLKPIGLGLSTYFLLVSSQVVLGFLLKKIKIAWLEKFEKEIISNQLEHDEILRRYKKEFSKGSDISNYL